MGNWRHLGHRYELPGSCKHVCDVYQLLGCPHAVWHGIQGFAYGNGSLPLLALVYQRMQEQLAMHVYLRL